MKKSDFIPSREERHLLFGSVSPVKGNKPSVKEQMVDLQNTDRDFFFDLDAVGVSEVKHPIMIESKGTPSQQTSIGTFELTTSLPRENKGINMSRLPELMNDFHEEGFSVGLDRLTSFTKEMVHRMDQQSAQLKVSFPWFFERKSPALGKTGMMHADCFINVRYEEMEGFDVNVGLTAAVTTLCPCSKEISEYSAHNQRGYIKIEAVLKDMNEQEDWKVMLLEAAESSASALLYPVLKRPDEKAVTEKAYENPRFVEDVTRLVAAELYEIDEVCSFSVECRNEESIHLHDAIARIIVDKRK
ncbi:GTP cyclohydrolase FolE2 [Bacillus shivajii]|uniref:GTP cyclohydrolase FolE2 n=1 Tax=Bacillus shivajii TaxID=1983719 RepID=UPI001CFC2199|nr:GTP cyclohydrolase FolE2 [Bacillus shivajii]UCZ54208.1 GTP cyclohydrolase FolE2 [Bacillus shivajii]